MKTRRIIFIFLLCITYISVCITINSEEEEFLNELQLRLKAYGWEDKEILPVKNAARHMNWENIDIDNCDIVAYSLQYCKRSGEKIEPGENAQIAYHLAITSSEMKALGFDDDVVVRVTVDSTREIVKDLHKSRNIEDEDAIGVMIRECIQAQVGKLGVNKQQEKLMGRVRNRIGKRRNRNGSPQGGSGNGPNH